MPAPQTHKQVTEALQKQSGKSSPAKTETPSSSQQAASPAKPKVDQSCGGYDMYPSRSSASGIYFTAAGTELDSARPHNDSDSNKNAQDSVKYFTFS